LTLSSLRRFGVLAGHPFGIAEGTLAFGLRVSFDGHIVQGTLFSGSESVSLRELCSELGLMDLRVACA
jgi:hypothetical protein